MSQQPRFMLIAPPRMEHSPAFDRAAALAKSHDAALHIVAFDYLEGLVTANLVDRQVLQTLRESYLERHRHCLEDQARPLRLSGLSVTTDVVWVEDPFSEILIYLKEQPRDALVKALEHHSRLSRIIFTPLDLHLLRECPAPLHFVGQTKNALPRRVLAAVDPFHRESEFKALNDRILHEAVKLAATCGAEIEVLYAHDPSAISAAERGFKSRSTLLAPKVAKALFDAQADAFNDLADRHGIPAEKRHMVMGSPVEVLCSFVSGYDVDVIVMGRVGYRNRGKLVGSTVEALLYKTVCSVWVVAPEILN